jgi:hypothetical protein
MVSILKYINLRDPNDRLLVYSLLILKKVLILYFIAIIFMFFVSLFTKSNNEKIIEGNWFKSDAQKRREYQAHLDRIARIRAAQERELQRCSISTQENWVSCGPKYFFPEAHFKDGTDKANAKTQKKIANSEQPDREKTTNMHELVTIY